ncbi:sugar porter (SP) family MFS transporter [Ancylobacter aquaticus]|uniref:Sugar porter (SP) family MFS transporter n=1 Tax=Ancylobacter aquaticus TaxID=100 RepID=A0A4R1I5Z8_ANCAQ|nr:sugar porter family MFS transporter [Ancylobacter aquaticus]TCK28069.1 sugar porter (SP) family MFS transporter [Ancylobacter aquaticus]
MLHLSVAIASLGGLLFGYETGVAAGALQQAVGGWGLDRFALLLVSTGTLVGALFGALVSGWLSDRIGRRDVIMATAALFTLGAFSGAVAPSIEVLFVARLIVGVAVGAMSAVGPTYIAEIAPARSRGALVTAFQLAITLGVLLAYGADEFFYDVPGGWRTMLGLGAAPALLLAGAALLLRESPLWLDLQDAQERSGSHGEGTGEASPFSIQGRQALLLCVGLFFFQQFVGINTLLYFAPSIMEGVDFSLGGGLLAGDALPLGIVNVLATICAIGLIDRVGRRPLLLASFIGSAAGLALAGAGLAFSVSEPGPGQAMAAAGVFLFVASFAIGLGPIPWVTAVEICPIRIRGMAIGLVAASHWLFDGIASPISLVGADEPTRAGIFAVYAGIAVTGFFLFRRAFPECKGLALATIDARAAAAAAAMRARGSLFVHYAVTALVTTGGLLNGFNFAITAAAIVLLARDWGLGSFEQGAVVSTLVLGLAVGSFLAGGLADRFGRRYLLMSTAALFVAGAFLSALAPSLIALLVARAAVGLAIGIASPTTGIYVAEISPSAIRGRLLSFEAATYGAGAILAYCVGIWFEATPEGWRYMFAFIAVPSTIYGLLLLPLPESPRWLAMQGRHAAARRVLRQFDERDVDHVLAEMETGQPEEGGGSWRQLASRVNRPIVVLGVTLMFLIVFCGWDMVLFYAPTLLDEIGFEDTTVNFVTTLGLSVVFLVATLISLGIVDQVGRKPLVVSGLVLMSGCLALLSLLHGSAAEPGGVAAWAMVAVLAVFVAVFALTLGQVGEIVVAEIFPQAIRGPGTSLSHGMRSLFAFAFTLTFPFVIDTAGLGLTFLSYAIINILGAAYLFRYMPETRNKTLEDIARYWRER